MSKKPNKSMTVGRVVDYLKFTQCFIILTRMPLRNTRAGDNCSHQTRPVFLRLSAVTTATAGTLSD